jgi:hypothetical protein
MGVNDPKRDSTSTPLYICPDCGEPGGTRHCMHCGTALTRVTRVFVCQRCAAEGSGRFCRECGGPIVTEEQVRRPALVRPTDHWWTWSVFCGACGAEVFYRESARGYCSECGQRRWVHRTEPFLQCSKCTDRWSIDPNSRIARNCGNCGCRLSRRRLETPVGMFSDAQCTRLGHTKTCVEPPSL